MLAWEMGWSLAQTAAEQLKAIGLEQLQSTGRKIEELHDQIEGGGKAGCAVL